MKIIEIQDKNIQKLLNRSLNHLLKYNLFKENKEDAFETSILGSFKINEFKNSKFLFNTLTINVTKDIDFTYDEFIKILNLTNYDFLYIEKDLNIYREINEIISKNNYFDEEIYLNFKKLINKTYVYVIQNFNNLNLTKTQNEKDFNNLISCYYLNDDANILEITIFNYLDTKGLILNKKVLTFNPLN